MTVQSRLSHVALMALLCFAILAPVVPITQQRARAMTTNVRWGYYITYDSTSLTSLKAHVGQLDIVAPYFYELNADGTIKDDLLQPDALTVMRNANVKIVPMIKNISRWDDFHNTISTDVQRNAIAQRLADLVSQNNYDGINIDFEAVNASDAPLITDLMSRISAKFKPLNKLVTQAVIARASDVPSTWGGAYDYAALAKYDDYMLVMAYDFHSAGGSAGAVAPIGWIQDVLTYATSRFPASRLLLGIGLYGYNWDTTAKSTATSARFDQVAAFLAKPGATAGYDETDQAPWVKYTDDQQHQHELWYENAKSFGAKIQLMIDDQLAGFGVWRLGQEDPAVWTVIGTLNTPATRIPPFPTQGTGKLYFDATGHSLAFGFKHFWENSGGLPVFGYPLTEEFSEENADTGKTYTVQYFERQRFEYHPEYQGTPYEVLLGRLGVADAQTRGLSNTKPFKGLPTDTKPADGCTFYAATAHTACGSFLKYWSSHGLSFGDSGVSYRESLALFGYPISEPFVDPATGYTVQYFERARFEYHPENAGTPYDVLLGLLGTDAVRAKGWIQ
ncbi:MAG: glycosyl hydrolase family 18 protein [Nitrolancea sp.]